MNRLRNRLIAAFLASTILPLAATVWITTSLLDRSLRYATTGELDRLSRTLEATVKQFYQRESDALEQDGVAGRPRRVQPRSGRHQHGTPGHGASKHPERRGRDRGARPPTGVHAHAARAAG